jgi:hypothetical protein
MTKDEALKMAREALKEAEDIIEGKTGQGGYFAKPINACEEALEQPAQEPVSWNEETFNNIAYAYRTCPAHEIEMVSQRYQELVDYVLALKDKNT